MASASGILPAVAAVLAQIDPQHRILVEQCEDGVRLVLRHEARCRHQHHLPAQMLMALAAPQSNPMSDHVLSFGGSTQEEARDAVSAPPPHEELGDFVSAIAALILAPPPGLRSIVESPPPESLLIARSTTRQI